jgi:F420-non-reducing hydrogenase iron-sulfur subunit
VSSAEAPRFAEVVTRFTEKIRGMGPGPMNRQKPAAAELRFNVEGR